MFALVALIYDGSMGLKAWFQDEKGTIHLMIGLNRENVQSLQRGDVFHIAIGPNVSAHRQERYCADIRGYR